MKPENCFTLGFVVRAHGTSGEVSIRLDVQDFTEYDTKEVFYLFKNGKMLPFLLEKIRPGNRNEVLFSFKELKDRTESELWVGSALMLPLDDLPELSESGFFYHELPKAKVIDKQLGDIGTVLRVEEFPAQDVVVVKHKDSEVLIPQIPQFVIGYKRESHELHTDLPEGLIEVYTSIKKKEK